MKEVLSAIAEGKTLCSGRSASLMADILDGRALPEQIGALLISLNYRTPSGAELAGFARALRERSITVPLSDSLRGSLLDVCGTGGDGQGTFNVSTTVAFLAAAAGLTVAKHGNRAVSSRTGSFDVLEALSIPFADTAAETVRSLSQFGLAFLYAPSFHPAFRELGRIRRALGVRTVLNVLGPLLNPTSPKRQLIGVFSEALLVPVAEALVELGTAHAMVVHGLDGADEVSLRAPSRIAHVRDGRISVFTFDPAEFGPGPVQAEQLQGGDPATSAKIMAGILDGEIGPRREMALMNAAAALVVGGSEGTLRAGYLRAAEVIDSGKAIALLEKMQGQNPVAGAS